MISGRAVSIDGNICSHHADVRDVALFQLAFQVGVLLLHFWIDLI